MKSVLSTVLLWVVLISGVGYIWFAAAEKIPATKSECESSTTLAQAVMDRNLNWHQVLVCPEKHTPKGFGLSFKFGRKED